MSVKENITQRQTFDRHTIEIQTLMREHDAIMQGRTGPELLAMRRTMIAALLELVAQQKRALDYMAGEKIEPQTHFAEAVLIGIGGGGAA